MDPARKGGNRIFFQKNWRWDSENATSYLWAHHGRGRYFTLTFNYLCMSLCGYGRKFRGLGRRPELQAAEQPDAGAGNLLRTPEDQQAFLARLSIPRTFVVYENVGHGDLTKPTSY